MNDMRQRLLEMERKNLIGKLITLIQLLVSVICIVTVAGSGMLPKKYLIFLIGALAVLFGATHILQYPKNKVLRYTGMIISLLMTIILAVISMGMMKTDDVLKKVGGATYKTDNMVVVVKKGDSAKSIEDAEDYRFGYQTAVDQKNTDKMFNEIESEVGKDVKSEEYSSLTDEAQALLDGKVDAAVFNEGYMSMIDESIDGFSEKVKILYQYGVKTKVKSEKKADVTEPRDYYVTIPGVSGDARDKLTHAGIYGVDASMATLENLYGIDISYYARVNFTSLETIVDALGGVDVNSEVEFEKNGYSFHKGVNHMNGAQALTFSRERYSFAEGDNQRGKDQEAVLTAIIQKATSPAIIKSANEILTTVGDCVETNMTSDEMAKFINMQLNNGGSWNIESQAASGMGDAQACYSSGMQLLYVMWPDENVVSDVSEKMQKVLK